MINSIKSVLSYSLRTSGVKANVDGVNTTILFKNDNIVISETPLALGNLITVNNNKYIITETDTPLAQSTYHKAKIETVDKVIINGTTTYSHVTFDKALEVTMSAFTVEKNKYKFIIPSMTVAVNDKITYKNDLYTIDYIDNTLDGIKVLYATFSGVKDEYSITLINNYTSIKVNDTYQIEYKCTKNGADVTNPIVSFKSNDDSIVTVSNDGVITGISEGETTILCTYEDSIAIFSIVVEQVVTLTPIKIVTENNKEEVKKGKTLLAYVYVDDGVQGSTITPTGRTFTFTLDDYSLAEIVSTTDTSCEIRGLVADEYCELIATDNADNSITASFYFYVTR